MQNLFWCSLIIALDLRGAGSESSLEDMLLLVTIALDQNALCSFIREGRNADE